MQHRCLASPRAVIAATLLGTLGAPSMASAPPATAPSTTQLAPAAATMSVSPPESAPAKAEVATPEVGPAVPVRISGLLFRGMLAGDPELDEAVRLSNTSGDRAVDVGGFALSDRHDPNHPKQRRGTAKLPRGAEIAPGAELWIAYSARGFERVFGFKPAFEIQESDPAVPNLSGTWPQLPARQGVLSLHDAEGRMVDLVAYDAKPDPDLKLAAGAKIGWRGRPVLLFGQTPLDWRGQILGRDRDARGRLRPDTNHAEDWDSGFRAHRLTTDPVHRVERPGQTRLALDPLKQVEASVLCSAAPENAFDSLAEAFDQAGRSIQISAYRVTSAALVDRLVAARERGVSVAIFSEGEPAGGLSDQSRALLRRLQQTGAEIHLSQRQREPLLEPRYRYRHGSYAIIDQRLVVIGSENFGRAGHPADPSFGNRGFEVQIEQADLVDQLQRVWQADLGRGRLPYDVVPAASPAGEVVLRPRDAEFKVEETALRGAYKRRRAALEVSGQMDLGLVLAPDNSLDEGGALLGMIRSAEKELLVIQNSVPLHWGGRTGAPETTPNLALAAVVEAAERGVSTRVLVDGSWYHNEPTDTRDNENTVAYLNKLARVKKLDLRAKVANLASMGLEKIHAKGVIVDRARVFVGSLNWSESSFKANREVGVVIGHPEVAGYFRELFLEDWQASRLYRVEIEAARASVWRDPGGGRRLRSLSRGTRVWVIGEAGRAGKGPAYLEIIHPKDGVGHVSRALTGLPLLAPRETPLHLGRRVRVEGRVLHTEVAGNGIRLRFTHGHGFAAVIFKHHADRFLRAGINPETTFTGKDVTVEGVLRHFHTPEIELKSPRQIEVVGGP